MTTASIKIQSSNDRMQEHDKLMEELVSKFDEMLGTDSQRRAKLKNDSEARKILWASISDQDKQYLKDEVFGSVLSQDPKGKPRKQISVAVLHGTFMEACIRWNG